MSESIESSTFVSHRARMSGELDSRKDLQEKKVEQRPQIFLKLSFRELSNSKLSGLQAFDYMAIYHSLKLCVWYFVSNFYFLPNDRPSKTMFLFHMKSSFGSWDIQIFVF